MLYVHRRQRKQKRNANVTNATRQVVWDDSKKGSLARVPSGYGTSHHNCLKAAATTTAKQNLGSHAINSIRPTAFGQSLIDGIGRVLV
jgi:hypothetical protein